MRIRTYLKNILIQFYSIFSSSRKSKAIFYHDLHLESRYTNMSTHVELFKQHVDILQKNGYEIVGEITKPYNQIQISFDDGFLGI